MAWFLSDGIKLDQKRGKKKYSENLSVHRKQVFSFIR